MADIQRVVFGYFAESIIRPTNGYIAIRGYTEMSAIENLPPGYRIIFVLHDIEGYEHNEIAEMMGCSIGNSKSQLHKARMKLRDLLRFTRQERATRR